MSCFLFDDAITLQSPDLTQTGATWFERARADVRRPYHSVDTTFQLVDNG